MNRRAYIIYRFFDFFHQKPTIGGVQTYLSDLMGILIEQHINPIICQMGERDLCVHESGYEARQVKVKDVKELVCRIKEEANLNEDLLIYGTDTLIVPNDGFTHSIAIQHGISWDIPSNTKHSLLRFVCATALQTFKTIKRVNCVKSLVCVDYNFQNWYRTQVDFVRTHLYVIPNYTQIAPKVEKAENVINVIFARRFFPYRGTRIFTNAIKRILDEYTNISVTIAGSGPDEEWMKRELTAFNNVEFIKYDSSESLMIHADKHIAVVPTVGSEGTSLSLLEAMSSQCAVVCSDVGGMTNIVLDGFNGKMVPAGDVEALYQAIKYLIDNPKERERIAKNGYETVKHGFSFEKWKEKWLEVIDEVASM